jgi:phenylpyruvate tautomerase PptA (4-oxalocrotonate tautomerase family)
MSRTIKFAKACGLDVLQCIETPLPAPRPHEVRHVQSDRHQSRRVDVAQGHNAVMRPGGHARQRARCLPICSGNVKPGAWHMPIVKIHVLEGQYDEPRLSNVSKAVQDALMRVLKIPPDDFFQIIHELPRNRFLHTPSFVGMKYSDDFILLEVAFISGRPKDTRLALLKELNARIVAGAGIAPDDLMIGLFEGPGENFSFGQGLAQREFVVQTT